MDYLLVIPIVILALIYFYFIVKKPVWLLASYLVAIPILPPLPLGALELTALDLLTVPTIILIIYDFSRNGISIRGKLPAGFFLYVAAAVISFVSFTLIHGRFSGQILFRLIRLIEMFLPLLLAVQYADQLKKDKAAMLFLMGTGLAAAAGIVMFLSGFSLRDMQSFALEGELLYRAGGTHGNSGSFGNLMGLAVLLACGALIYLNEIADRAVRTRLLMIALVCGAVSLVGLIASLSRGGMLLILTGLCILLAPLVRRPTKLIKIMAVAAIVLALILGILYTQFDNRLMTGAAEVFQRRILGLGEITSDFETISSHRNVVWNMAWNIFRANPPAWPFGLGFKALSQQYNIPPDNNFMQALFEMGIFGAIALITLLVFGLMAAIQTIRRDKAFGIIFLALWIGLMSNMLSADVLTYWHNIPPLFILLIILGRCSPNKKQLP